MLTERAVSGCDGFNFLKDEFMEVKLAWLLRFLRMDVN